MEDNVVGDDHVDEDVDGASLFAEVSLVFIVEAKEEVSACHEEEEVVRGSREKIEQSQAFELLDDALDLEDHWDGSSDLVCQIDSIGHQKDISFSPPSIHCYISV